MKFFTRQLSKRSRGAEASRLSFEPQERIGIILKIVDDKNNGYREIGVMELVTRAERGFVDEFLACILMAPMRQRWKVSFHFGVER